MAQRPRDQLGRPLPPGATAIGPAIPVGIADAKTAIEIAQELLEAGLPFHAHEVFEEQWRVTNGPSRDIWRALAQFAAGLTHAARGNSIGANRLRERAELAVAEVVSWPAAFPLSRLQVTGWLSGHPPEGTARPDLHDNG